MDLQSDPCCIYGGFACKKFRHGGFPGMRHFPIPQRRGAKDQQASSLNPGRHIRQKPWIAPKSAMRLPN